MPMYVRLYEMTEKGATEIKKSPVRMNDAIDAGEATGGTTRVVLATMGEYDFVSVGEAPSDEVAATFAAPCARLLSVPADRLEDLALPRPVG